MSQNLFENTFDSLFQQFGIPKYIAASDIYLSQGSVFKKVFYINKGILRSFYITDSGEEKTVFFRWEGQITAVPECIFDDEPTRQNWQALENCELLEIDFSQIEKVSEYNASLLRKRLVFSHKMLLEALQRLESFVLDKPEERYLKLITQKPELVKRVADKYIASFIGVTPVSLSRIRKRLISKQK
jgi:CRP-like cAMP-binding protein